MALVNIVLALFLAPILGALGICISIFIAYMIRTIGMDIIFYQDLHINVIAFFRDTFIDLLMPLILCLVLGLIINAVIRIESWVGFILKGTCFVCSYVLVMYFFAMNENEKRLILSPVKRILRTLK